MARAGGIAAAVAILAGAAAAQPSPAPTPAPVRTPVDYTADASWLCRPGRRDSCAVNLDVLEVQPSGARKVVAFKAAINPPIDCFYVYPTVSQQPGPYSDLTVDKEEAAVARVQIARFASRCRVFAPMYRQLTGPGLSKSLQPGSGPIDWAPPYLDVRDAWRDYLARDNHGRGVVIIGHSQGSILLARLIANEVDGRPVAKKMVSALLPGHPAIAVPQGGEVGGLFKTTPLCRAPGQVGCVVVFSSYASEDNSDHRVFGADPGQGQVAACINPGAPGGGSAKLTAYFPKPKTAPEADPPFVEGVDAYSGECVRDAQGSVLRIKVEPGVLADADRTALATIPLRHNGWGLHAMDMTINQGALLDLVDAETRTWLARKP